MHTKFGTSGPSDQRLIDTNGLICSRVDEEERDRHAGENRHRAFNVEVVRRAPPNGACNVPVLFRKANHARYREGWRADTRGRQVHEPESTGGVLIRPFLVGRDVCPLAGGSFV